jgi:hypothetical protein
MSRTIRKIALVQPRQPMPSITPSDQMVLPRYGVPLIATILKNAGYDGTVTVEVFGDDTDYLVMSRQKFTMMWDETSPGEPL